MGGLTSDSLSWLVRGHSNTGGLASRLAPFPIGTSSALKMKHTYGKDKENVDVTFLEDLASEEILVSDTYMPLVLLVQGVKVAVATPPRTNWGLS